MTGTRPLRSSDVEFGVCWPAMVTVADEELDVQEAADGVLRCLLKYDEDRGSAGAGECVMEAEAGLAPLNDGRRLVSGEEAADEAGERLEGGV